jgi:hypothetical protein
MDFLEEMDEKLEDLRDSITKIDQKFERLIHAIKDMKDH